MTVDFESDQFLTLLTDALRSGPGSPAWHEAVSKLRQEGVEGADEYKLLLDTRQNLESGKPYREIRAGAGFTKKVMTAIDEESSVPAHGKGIPTPTIIVIAAAIVGIAVVVLLGWIFNTKPQPPTILDLQNDTFAQDLLTAPFAKVLPAGWNKIGSMGLTFDKEMSPSDRQGSDKHGCGIVTSAGFPANQPVAIEVTMRPPGPNDEVVMQVFVTDDPNFSADRGTSAHELVWDLQSVPGKGGKVLRPQLVLPDGTFGATGEDLRADKDTLTVSIKVDANFALVESDGKHLYAGPIHLAADKPRYFGVRFLRTKDSYLRNLPAVEAMRILK